MPVPDDTLTNIKGSDQDAAAADAVRAALEGVAVPLDDDQGAPPGLSLAGDDQDDQGDDQGDAPAAMDAGQFASTVRDALGMASAVSGLKSVAVPDDLAKPFQAAMIPVHEFAELHAPWLLDLSEDGWLARVLPVAAFAVPYGLGIRAELLARRAGPESAAPTGARKSAGTGAAPPDMSDDARAMHEALGGVPL